MHSENEIGLKELLATLWNAKWWIILITGSFVVASVFYALSIPNQYKSTAILAPARPDAGGNLGALSRQIGGLANIAGVKLGGAETDVTPIAIELMKTWGFTEDFIEKHGLEVPIFAARGWNRSENRLIINQEIYDSKTQKWIREAPEGKTVEPTSWELYKVFSNGLSVSQNKENGLITVGFTHYSPRIAKQITEQIIVDINQIMQERALKKANDNINYLNQQVKNTSLTEMQNIFFSLIQEQIKDKMLAQVESEYAFKVISKPMVPEEKVLPKRVIIVLAGLLLGAFVSVVLVLLRRALRD